MSNNNDFNIIYYLSILTNILQIANYEENVSQSSNDDIMKALDVQTKVILERIEEKLDKILEDKNKEV